MIARDDDEPNDPRRFRRTLVPLEIEDADKPPSLRRRFTQLLRKKENGKDGSEALERRPLGPSPDILPKSANQDTGPLDGNDGGESSGQDL
jgi:hypothetical protein